MHQAKKIALLLILLLSSFKLVAQEPAQIHLIYLADSPAWEKDWIKELLSEINYTVYYDQKYEYVVNHAIIVITTAVDNAKLERYLSKFRNKKYDYGIIHLSDELYQAQTNCYRHAKFVFRNYWHKKFARQKEVLFFPLGYKQGFWNNISKKQIKEVSQRKYIWSFMGQVAKSTRMSMIDNMRQIPNFFFYETFSFFDPNALKIETYRDVLLESIFVPCPRGYWNLDSFRPYEALECGCIPIVEKSPLDYFGKFYGNYPFLAVNSWNEAPALINGLLEDPEKLEQLRLQCQQWWLNYKMQLKTKMTKQINDSFK